MEACKSPIECADARQRTRFVALCPACQERVRAYFKEVDARNRARRLAAVPA